MHNSGMRITDYVNNCPAFLLPELVSSIMLDMIMLNGAYDVILDTAG